MRKLINCIICAATLATATVSCKKESGPKMNEDLPPATNAITVVSGSGDITAKVNAFLAAIPGPDNGGIPFLQPTGKRNINFDGVPDNFSDNNPFPGDFFNVNSKRGLVLSSFNGFRVSSKNFSDINPAFGIQYNPFSPVRTIAVMGGSVFATALFKVPGTDTAAFVRAFGVVLCDVDDSSKTFVEFFEGNNIVGKFNVPARNNAPGDKGLSFLGVQFSNKKITSVKIQAGNATINTKQESGDADLVAMDNFIYSEPVKQ
ncbi:MAG: hypothetical protein H7Y86_16515 [Rhizobacter sp.]|nr:hypothetical protein [Ferruginibacter sp.]